MNVALAVFLGASLVASLVIGALQARQAGRRVEEARKGQRRAEKRYGELRQHAETLDEGLQARAGTLTEAQAEIAKLREELAATRWEPQLVRLHFKETDASAEGILLEEPGMFYRLGQTEWAEDADRSVGLAGETWFPREKVLMMQVNP